MKNKQILFDETASILADLGFTIVQKDTDRPWGGFFVIEETQAPISAELRRILRAALEKPTSEAKPKRTLYDAFIELGRVAPDFEFEQKRTRSKPRSIQF